MTHNKRAAILAGLALVAVGMATLPTASANNRTSCYLDVCASAAVSANFKKNPWWMPDTVTFFCGWMGYSSLLGGQASGYQTGTVIIPECNGACNWSGQGGCGDQGSAYLLSTCQGGIEQWAFASTLFPTSAYAISNLNCSPSSTPSATLAPPSLDIQGYGQFEVPPEPTPEPTIVEEIRDFFMEARAKSVFLKNPDLGKSLSE